MIYRKPLRRAVVAGAAVLALGLTACSGSTDEGAEAGGGGIVQIYGGASGQLTKNFNPLTPTVLAGIKGGVYESLFYVNPLAGLDEEPLPILGESFELSEDGTEIVVQVKDGIEWSDGEQFTADDVAFTFNLVRDTPALDITGNTPAAEATGESEVTLTFDRPSYTDVPNVLGGQFIVPEHVWSEKEDVATDINEEAVGTGALTLGEFTPQSYVLDKSESYRDADDFAPGGVRYYSLSGNQAATDKYLGGELDFAGIFIPDINKVLEPYPNLGISPEPPSILEFTACANADLGCVGPQTDPAVRQAIAAAFDREQIGELAFYGLVSPVSPTIVNLEANPDLIADEFKDATYSTEPNLELAASLLEDAGWTMGPDGIYEKDGQPLSLSILVTSGYTDYIATVEVATQQLAEAGIDLNAEELASQEVVNRRTLGQFQLAIDGMFPGPTSDPYYFYDKYFGSASTAPVGEAGNDPYGNVSRFTSPIVDEAIAAAGSTTDVEEKAAAYATVQEVIVSAIPYIPVLTQDRLGLHNTDNWTGFPTNDDPYATASGSGMGLGVILNNLEPVE